MAEVDSRSVELTVVRRFPHPVAAAWSRFRLRSEPSAQLVELHGVLEVLLRTLVSMLLPDYLRGASVDLLEDYLRKLQRPSLGHF